MNITLSTMLSTSAHTHTPLLETLRRFAHNPVLIAGVPELERPCVIVLVSRGWLRAWRDESERFGYEITPAGLEALER